MEEVYRLHIRKSTWIKPPKEGKNLNLEGNRNNLPNNFGKTRPKKWDLHTDNCSSWNCYTEKNSKRLCPSFRHNGIVGVFLPVIEYFAYKIINESPTPSVAKIMWNANEEPKNALANVTVSICKLLFFLPLFSDWIGRFIQKKLPKIYMYLKSEYNNIML